MTTIPPMRGGIFNIVFYFVMQYICIQTCILCSGRMLMLNCIFHYYHMYVFMLKLKKKSLIWKLQVTAAQQYLILYLSESHDSLNSNQTSTLTMASLVLILGINEYQWCKRAIQCHLQFLTLSKNNQSMLIYDGFVNNMWMMAELTWKGMCWSRSYNS
jgi:hypothetical protein